MLVNTDVVVDLVSATEGIGQFQIVFSRDEGPSGMDRMTLRIEADDGTALPDDLAELVQRAVSLRPEIELVARGSLYDQERSIKMRRVIDLRPPAE
jgi:phenylacetate-coenzyme A ligase PaaK-like adenylate-forming protein